MSITDWEYSINSCVAVWSLNKILFLVPTIPHTGNYCKLFRWNSRVCDLIWHLYFLTMNLILYSTTLTFPLIQHYYPSLTPTLLSSLCLIIFSFIWHTSLFFSCLLSHQPVLFLFLPSLADIIPLHCLTDNMSFKKILQNKNMIHL